ncbi:cytosolic phospholipase A2 delta isoform X2 [Microcaecilia unicolor]|uniref:Phospholipase A2 n=1 Tax=Microcaecilia unicolor TaxID=1415580 RepID=A0A6P7YT12_9AMPH|nr:cytosolic phospholipase A2 delta isoform X2 [Microcaecilia unicolor]
MMPGGMSADTYQEDAASWLLSVRVIQCKNVPWADLMSKADCYVCLWLPSSMDEKFQTKTISNSRTPVWDETFHFKICDRTKNVLQLSLHDEDVISKDDHLYTVFFDVEKIKPDETVFKKFPLNPEGKQELEVEFKLTRIVEPSENIITNGVLVSREVSCLEIRVDKQRNAKLVKEKDNIVLAVKGSYEKAQRMSFGSGSSPNTVDTFRFHSLKCCEPELTATVESGFGSSFLGIAFGGDSKNEDFVAVPLKSLPLEQAVRVALPTAEGKQLELELKTKECSKKPDVQLGFDLREEEKLFLQKRKKVVSDALKKVLQLDKGLQEHEVPVVAVMTTGGGVRAMTSLYGTLLGLQKSKLLDCVSYITGASGSTWTMSKLYEDTDWSRKDLKEPINDARKHVTKSKTSIFSWERLKYYRKELSERAEEGHKTSFTDLWGLMIEFMFHDGILENKLSDQQRALNNGQNPLPLCLAMNVKENDNSTLDFKEWCEFSPYEVRLLKYGASIRAEDFGSEFFMGRLMKKVPESKLCYLQGLWSNIFSINLLDAWFSAMSSEHFWHRWTRDRLYDIDEESLMMEKRSSDLNTHVLSPSGSFSDTLRDILTSRPLDGEHHNFLKGLQLHKSYNEHSDFCSWRDTELDLYPNQLTPSAEDLCLVDSAYYINASYPPLLRKARKVDVILSFDYGLTGHFNSVEQTYHYCTKQEICFPKIVLSEEERKNPKECYLFADDKDPEAPVILHFPLVNDTFKKYKAPGVKRSPAELEDGVVHLTGSRSPYRLLNLTYSEREFNQLLNLTAYNVENNKDLILQAFRTALGRRKNAAAAASGNNH